MITYILFKTGTFVELLEEINSLNELLNRSSTLTIAELVTRSLNEGLISNYNEVKYNLRNRYFSALQCQFATNLVSLTYVKVG